MGHLSFLPQSTINYWNNLSIFIDRSCLLNLDIKDLKKKKMKDHGHGTWRGSKSCTKTFDEQNQLTFLNHEKSNLRHLRTMWRKIFGLIHYPKGIIRKRWFDEPNNSPVAPVSFVLIHQPLDSVRNKTHRYIAGIFTTCKGTLLEGLMNNGNELEQIYL